MRLVSVALGSMLIVLGLMSLEEAGTIVGVVLVVVWWILLVMPLKAVLALVIKVYLLGWLCTVLVGLEPLYQLMARETRRHDVDEAWDEVQDLGVVGEREVVGEPRRAQHALVAKVDMGSLGKLTLTFEPTPVHR